MKDWLLEEAIEDVRALLSELDDDCCDPATKDLRTRTDALTRASSALASEDAQRQDVLSLASLALSIRDEAVALRSRHSSFHRLVQSMID